MSDGPSRRSSLFNAPRSETDVFAAARTGDETVGAALARVREANGLQVSDIAQHLRIRETFLVALEEGDLAKLPGNTYAIGFVRSYANLLGVDGGEAVALFKQQRAGETDPAALVFPEPVAESRIPKGAILFISVLLAAAAYGGWYYMSAHDMELADLVPEVPAALRDDAPESQGAAATDPSERTVPAPEAQQETETVPGTAAPPADRMAAQAPEPASTPEPEPRPETEPEPGPQPSASQSRPAAEAGGPSEQTAEPAPSEPPASEPSASEPETSASAAPTPSNPRIVEAVPQPPSLGSSPESAPGPAGEAAGEPAPTPDGSATGETARDTEVARSDATIELHARSDSWVQIRGGDGRVVLMRILRTGDSYTVPREAGLTLMTGNAGAIEITVDGETVPAIGPVGAVRRDVALDAARLRAGTAVDR